MQPIKSAEANRCWKAPYVWDRDEPCTDLWAKVTDDGLSISCWRPSIRERLRLLFGKPIWLTVVGRQPPIALES